MDVVADLHRVIIEGAAISLVRRSTRKHIQYASWYLFSISKGPTMAVERNAPDNTVLPNDAVPAQRDDNCMTWPCPPQIPAYDSTTRDYGLSSKDYILRARNGSSSRDFVACVLLISTYGRHGYRRVLTVSMYSDLM